MSVCPACNTSSETTLIRRATNHRAAGGTFSIVRCNTCDFLYTIDAPDEANIGPYYEMPFYMPHKNTIPLHYRFIRYARNLGKLRMLRKKPGTIVDIGCGTGTFLAVAKTKAWKVLGVEPDPEARALCESVGVPTLLPADVSSIPDASADAIILWHSLEHIHDFKGTLSHCKRILKKDGTMLLCLPNISSPEATWYGDGWAGIDVPIHLYHFTPESIRRVLKDAGFTLEAIRSTWTEAIICCILSERFSGGYFLRGVIRGLRSTVIGWMNPTHSSCPAYICKRS